jgi:oligoendopeptidase F
MLDTKKIKTEWDLTPLYKSDTDPKIEKDKKIVEKKVNAFVKKWEKRSDYLKNPKVLKQALDEYEDLNAKYSTHGDFGVYFWLKSELDMTSSNYKAINNQLEDFSTKLENKLQFFSIRVAKVDKKTQKIFLSSKILGDYRHYLQKLFNNSKFLLSEEEEKILNLKSSVSHSDWAKMVEEFISKEEREYLDDKGKKKLGGFEVLLKTSSYGKTKKQRDIAFKQVNDILAKHVASAEHEINALLKNKKIDDELRGLTRPDQARHLADDMDSEVVDAMIKAVTENFKVPKKYYKVKAQLLKKKHLQYNERNLSIGEIKTKFDFNKSSKLVYETFEKVDPEFSEIFRSFLYSGNIDVSPKKGKSGGAYCAKFLKSLPVYVLLNHNNTVNDVTTIAHEMGHAINDELMRVQNSLNFGTTLSTAEVASTFMEDFVIDELKTRLSEEEKFVLLFEGLNDFVSTIYRQVAAYNFETDLHREFREKGYLSHAEIGKIFTKNMRAYMGSAVTYDAGSENWWVYWRHFRRFFYVYTYASGLLISKSLQAKAKQDPKFIEKVKEFLAAGCSDSPKNLFKKMGVDISDSNFWKEGLKEIEDQLNEAERLAKKLGKI